MAATDTTTMKIALFTLDNWYLWSQIAVVLCGAAALITGKMVNDRQSSKNAEQARQLLGLETNLEKQREKTAQAEVQIEKLRNANLTLEAAISNRTFKNQGGAASRLKKFGKVKAAIPYVQTDEALGTAKQIAWALWRAGWSLQPRANVPTEAIFFAEGVSVCSSDESLSDARLALVDELNKTGITATSVANSRMPIGMIVILVGVKPNPLEEKFVQDSIKERIDAKTLERKNNDLLSRRDRSGGTNGMPPFSAWAGKIRSDRAERYRERRERKGCWSFWNLYKRIKFSRVVHKWRRSTPSHAVLLDPPIAGTGLVNLDVLTASVRLCRSTKRTSSIRYKAFAISFPGNS